MIHRQLRLFKEPFEPVNEDAVKCSTEDLDDDNKDCVDQAANVCRPLTAIRKKIQGRRQMIPFKS